MAYQNISGITGIGGVFDYANSVTDNIYGIGILISLYIIIFSYLKVNRQEDAPNCASVAGFVTSLAAIFLFLMGIVTGTALFTTIMVTVLSVIWAYFHKG